MNRYVSTLCALSFLVGALASCQTVESMENLRSEADLQVRSQGRLDMVSTDLSPRDGEPVFLGIASRLRNRDEELLVAIRHVAEQASRYTQMVARYEVYIQETSREARIADHIQTDWDGTLAEQLIESVEVLEEVQNGDSTYILARVEGIRSLPQFALNWEFTTNGQPSWVNHPPQVPGYVVAVGAAMRRRQFRDSLDFADQSALQTLLMQSSASVSSMTESLESSAVGNFQRTIGHQEASSIVEGFLVVARYAPDDGSYYYSMIIARRD